MQSCFPHLRHLDVVIGWVFIAFERAKMWYTDYIVICGNLLSAWSSIKSGSARKYQDLVNEIVFKYSKTGDRNGVNVVISTLRNARKWEKRPYIQMNFKLSQNRGERHSLEGNNQTATTVEMIKQHNALKKVH